MSAAAVSARPTSELNCSDPHATVTPLTSTLGAEVNGLDLGRSLSPDQTTWVRRALVEHKVLFFRRQHLTPSEQVTFAAHLGQLTPAHPLAGGLDDEHPEILLLDSS